MTFEANSLNGPLQGVLIAVVTLIIMLMTCWFLLAILRSEDVFRRWAKQAGLRVIHRQAPKALVFRNPFEPLPSNVVYEILVEDPMQGRRRGRISLGMLSAFGFKEKIEVHWEEG